MEPIDASRRKTGGDNDPNVGRSILEKKKSSRPTPRLVGPKNAPGAAREGAQTERHEVTAR